MSSELSGRRTRSGVELEVVHDPSSLRSRHLNDLEHTIGRPGEPPFTRGITSRGYLDQPWIMGQYAGHGSAEETNARFKTLLARGGTGFSVALDLPTQMGFDSDDPLAQGEVGKVGVAIDSLADMEALFDGIDLGAVRQIRTTANAIGPVWVALVVALAEKRGVDPNSIRILIQNDVLKEYIARGTYIVPPNAGVRIAADTIEYCCAHLPAWTPLAMSGYHIRESGATAIQEIALTFANGIAYCQEVARRGVAVDSFAPSLFTFLSAGTDVMEEVAKFRAARTVWNGLVAELGGTNPESRALRIFAFTAGSNLTAQQPLNNIVRVTLAAAAAVIGGCQTLHTSAYDEALATPTVDSATVALRTQQILLHESGLADVLDPLGGSYLVESLTQELTARIEQLLTDIDLRGGAVACIESGWFTGLLEDSAYDDILQVDAGRRPVVGVNVHRTDEHVSPEVFTVDAAVERAQIMRLRQLRDRRDATAVKTALEGVAEALRSGENCVPAILDAVRRYATIGEIGAVMRQVHGRFQAVPARNGP